MDYTTALLLMADLSGFTVYQEAAPLLAGQAGRGQNQTL